MVFLNKFKINACLGNSISHQLALLSVINCYVHLLSPSEEECTNAWIQVNFACSLCPSVLGVVQSPVTPVLKATIRLFDTNFNCNYEMITTPFSINCSKILIQNHVMSDMSLTLSMTRVWMWSTVSKQHSATSFR